MQSKLEQIRATVEETTLPGYPHLHLSLSIGAVLQGSADPLEEAVHRADSLMYQAKAKKNAIVLEAGPLTLRERDLRQQRKRQILIVDDSEPGTAPSSPRPCSSDYRILEAPDSEEGTGTAATSTVGDIALVLLDINIPVQRWLCRAPDYMTRNHAIEDIPVIMISSETSGDIHPQGLRDGRFGLCDPPVRRQGGVPAACQQHRQAVRQAAAAGVGWSRTRPASRSTTPPCWWAC